MGVTALTWEQKEVFDKHSRSIQLAEVTEVNPMVGDARQGAEKGVWHIYYTAEDRKENPQCAIVRRTVIVRDTLPPVISLHLRKATNSEQLGNPQAKRWPDGQAEKIIQWSDGGESQDTTNAGRHSNPAAEVDAGNDGNPFLISSKFAPGVSIPTAFPTPDTTAPPSKTPTAYPTASPTKAPTDGPTKAPTAPTPNPTIATPT